MNMVGNNTNNNIIIEQDVDRYKNQAMEARH